jgi:hypothetical protein
VSVVFIVAGIVGGTIADHRTHRGSRPEPVIIVIVIVDVYVDIVMHVDTVMMGTTAVVTAAVPAAASMPCLDGATWSNLVVELG